jgi:hypothetical protein
MFTDYSMFRVTGVTNSKVEVEAYAKFGTTVIMLVLVFTESRLTWTVNVKSPAIVILYFIK